MNIDIRRTVAEADLMGRLNRGQQAATLDGWAESLQDTLRTAVAQGGPAARRLKDWLHGTWLGHPLHPAMTDVPVGAWATGALLDLLGATEAADASITVGVLAAVPTALAGAADWSETTDTPRRVGLLHALLNTAALGCMLGSLLARRTERRVLGIGLSTTGLSLATVSAWLGGELVYAQGVGVSRNAWEPGVDDFQPVASLDSLTPGRLTAAEATVGGQKVPLVLFRRGQEVLALSSTCSHMGGPLAEGEVVDGDCVACPWHGSTFRLADGSVVHGPASVPQPAFETRVRAGTVEVRRR